MSKEKVTEPKIPYILIVDDVAANLKLLSDTLKAEGYKIRPVPNGALALQVAEKEKPALILLDIMMPGMNGYKVCRQLKENPKLKDVPVIFISALNDTNDIVKGLNLGGVDYITKPFRPEEIKARVSTHLKLHLQSIELLRKNRELQEINVTKDKLFSIMAHDLRSPFTSLLGLTKIMTENIKTLSPEKIEKMAGILNKSARNLFNLLENLLQWARMQQGNISFNPESFLLFFEVSGCISSIFDSAENKGIEINLNIPDNLEVLADMHMFETVIRNVIFNAVKFTPKGGRITVSAKTTANNFAEISIRDTGIGMNNELMSKLFKLDEQTGRTGTEGEPTTGLGLIICKDFIERHGGKIWVESEEGKGSTFYFTFPLNK
jgi:signal transduction histidine kinase